MDRRTVLALVLVAAVILLTPKLFAPPPVVPPAADSVALTDSVPRRADTATTQAPAAPAVVAPRDTAVVRIPAETLHVADSNASITFVNSGAALYRVELKQYKSLAPADGPVVIEGRGEPLLRFRGIVGRDTIGFDTATFRVLRNENRGTTTQLAFEGVVGSDTLTLD